jgi:hypothetical protein
MVVSKRVIGHAALAVVLGSALAWAQAPSTPMASAGSAAQAPARGQGPGLSRRAVAEEAAADRHRVARER